MFKNLLCAIAFVVLVSGSASAASLGFEVAPSLIADGESTFVDVVVSGLEADDLLDFNIDITFDESILTVAGFTLTDELGDLATSAIDLSFGDVGGGVFNANILGDLFLDFPSQPDTFTLFTVEFVGSGLGTSPLGFGMVELVDPFSSFITPDLTGASVRVVPVPAAVWLLGAGLAGLVGLRKRA